MPGKERFTPSALNYTGSKFRLLPQMAPLLPKCDGTFYDVFAGGGAVSVNARAMTGADRVVVNDLERHVLDFMRFLSEEQDVDALVADVKSEISRFGLSDTARFGYAHYGVTSSQGLASVNKEAYAQLRKEYNAMPGSGRDKQLLFYLLIVFSFNNQVRFNSHGDYNLPAGKRDFNISMERKLRRFVEALSSGGFDFRSDDFRDVIPCAQPGDFLYCDPPYRISLAGYNEKGGWTEQDDRDLMTMLDDAAGRGVRFAMSNVVEHKGKSNDALLEWAAGHDLHEMSFDYNNSNYQSKAKGFVTREVLIMG